jgi:hypothetical protein
MPILAWGLSIKKLFLLVLFFPLSGLYANEEVYETDVTFHNFPWGTSQETVVRSLGEPVSREEINGLVSLVWENTRINGYTTFTLAYFSRAGLQGGTYYFMTNDMDDLVRCYNELQQDLLNRYGPTPIFRNIHKEQRPYECEWSLPGGYIQLRVNTRDGNPVSLFHASPELARLIFGNANPATARR